MSRLFQGYDRHKNLYVSCLIIAMFLSLAGCGKSDSDEEFRPEGHAEDQELEDRNRGHKQPQSTAEAPKDGAKGSSHKSDDDTTNTVAEMEDPLDSFRRRLGASGQGVKFNKISCRDMLNFTYWNLMFHVDNSSGNGSSFLFHSRDAVLKSLVHSFDEDRIFLSNELVDFYVSTYMEEYDDKVADKNNLCQLVDELTGSLSRLVAREAEEVLARIAALAEEDAASYPEPPTLLADPLQTAKLPYVQTTEELPQRQDHYLKQRYAKLSRVAQYLSDQAKKDILAADVRALQKRMQNLDTSQAYSLFLQAYSKSFKWGGAFYDAGHSYLDLSWILGYMGIEVVPGKDYSYLLVSAVRKKHRTLGLSKGDIIEAIRIAPSKEWIPVSELTRGVIYEDFKLSAVTELPQIDLKVYPSAMGRGGGDHYGGERELPLHWLSYLPSHGHYLSQFQHDFRYYLLEVEKKEGIEEVVQEVVEDEAHGAAGENGEADDTRLLYLPISSYHIGGGQRDAVEDLQAILDSVYERWDVGVTVIDLRHADLDHRYLYFIASLVDIFAGFDIPLLIKKNERTFPEDFLAEQTLSREGKKYRDMPLVLLVSEKTAGTAELFVSYLATRNRAVVVGDFATAGKGVQLNQIKAKRERYLVGYLDVPFFEYYTSQGEPLSDVGWVSDVPIPTPASLYQSMMWRLAPQFLSLQWEERRAYDKVLNFGYVTSEVRTLLLERSYQRSWSEYKNRSEDLPKDAVTFGNAGYWFSQSVELKEQIYPHIPARYLYNPMWYVSEIIELFHGYATGEDHADVTIEDGFVRAYAKHEKELEELYQQMNLVEFHDVPLGWGEISPKALELFHKIMDKDYVLIEALTVAVDYYTIFQTRPAAVDQGSTSIENDQSQEQKDESSSE